LITTVLITGRGDHAVEQPAGRGEVADGPVDPVAFAAQLGEHVWAGGHDPFASFAAVADARQHGGDRRGGQPLPEA